MGSVEKGVLRMSMNVCGQQMERRCTPFQAQSYAFCICVHGPHLPDSFQSTPGSYPVSKDFLHLRHTPERSLVRSCLFPMSSADEGVHVLVPEGEI